jgi:hypothetical protein
VHIVCTCIIRIIHYPNIRTFNIVPKTLTSFAILRTHSPNLGAVSALSHFVSRSQGTPSRGVPTTYMINHRQLPAQSSVSSQVCYDMRNSGKLNEKCIIFCHRFFIFLPGIFHSLPCTFFISISFLALGYFIPPCWIFHFISFLPFAFFIPPLHIFHSPLGAFHSLPFAFFIPLGGISFLTLCIFHSTPPHFSFPALHIFHSCPTYFSFLTLRFFHSPRGVFHSFPFAFFIPAPHIFHSYPLHFSFLPYIFFIPYPSLFSFP